ncbi:protein kinase domain-containing protein [Scytonema sp. NUACC26]|uniref:protein kinase domain-containing protein n=1 Tax=Scytonema sp. NUACC26 TaxID=3140176 RepID=UPI0038B3154E
MSYCLNPFCPNPQRTDDGKFCLTCGSKLLLKERYRAIKPIGQGGFGRTFLAMDEDKPSKPRCVIKQFYPQAQGTSTVEKAVELFTQEAMRLDELGKHPQIPELLAYFTQDDRQYLVQEFIDGLNLAEELAQRAAFNEVEIRHLLNDLLPVLQFCHERQVIHRDIKPENIIRRKSAVSAVGNLVLVDFGAAKAATYTALNRTGTSIGSPEYVAPEQIRGKAVFASDIFSLGVTCIHLLTQCSPFDIYDTYNATWVWQQHLKTPVSNELRHILDKMLEPTVAQRYQTVNTVLTDLNHQQQVAIRLKPLGASPIVPPTIINPVSTPQETQKSTFVNTKNDPIDKELQEIKTKFLGGSSSTNSNNISTNTQFQPSQKPQPSSKNIIDEELEELKAKYKNENG